MARPERRPADTRLPEDGADEESDLGILRRLAESLGAQRQHWVRNGGGISESECTHLIEIVYAIADLQGRAQEMRLDFVGYLLGMTLEEALNLLRAAETRG